MAYRDIGMRHIEVIGTTSLLVKVNGPMDHGFWSARAGERFALQPARSVHLSHSEVQFLESAWM